MKSSPKFQQHQITHLINSNPQLHSPPNSTSQAQPPQPQPPQPQPPQPQPPQPPPHSNPYIQQFLSSIAPKPSKNSTDRPISNRQAKQMEIIAQNVEKIDEELKKILQAAQYARTQYRSSAREFWEISRVSVSRSCEKGGEREMNCIQIQDLEKITQKSKLKKYKDHVQMNKKNTKNDKATQNQTKNQKNNKQSRPFLFAFEAESINDEQQIQKSSFMNQLYSQSQKQLQQPTQKTPKTSLQITPKPKLPYKQNPKQSQRSRQKPNQVPHPGSVENPLDVDQMSELESVKQSSRTKRLLQRNTKKDMLDGERNRDSGRDGKRDSRAGRFSKIKSCRKNK